MNMKKHVNIGVRQTDWIEIVGSYFCAHFISSLSED